MWAKEWIRGPVNSLLDVGCNVGALLKDCQERFPTARLAGIEINEPAFLTAKQNLPAAELHCCGVEALPFASEIFDYVTCIEVLEHIPAELRPVAFREMRRVLKPGGSLILTVPHAGWFAWLDSNNVRLRFPGLYRRLVGKGKRDAGYAAVQRQVEWHYHFTLGELEDLAGSGWERLSVRRGGLLLSPLMDWLSWPFYRLGKPEHSLRQMFERIAAWDYNIDFGRASYGILLVLKRTKTEQTAADIGP